MSEKLDNELRDRINEVFEQYEDTAPAQEGWLLLREKFPEKKKRRVAPLWWSAAAVLLLLSIFGTWMYTQQSKHETVAVKPVNQSLHPVTPSTQAPANNAPGSHSESSIDNIAPFAKQHYAARGTQRHSNSLKPLNKLPEQDVYADRIENSQQLTANIISKVNGGTAHQQLPATIITGADSAKKTGNTKLVEQQSILAQQAVKAEQNVTAAAHKDSVKVPGESKMSIYLANEQKKEAAQKKDTKTRLATDKKILYNVYAATYFNYAEGSKSQVNTGAGFGTDIKLAGNFKLSTGIAIGRNTLNYNTQPTQSGLVMDAVRAASGPANGVFMDAAPASFGFSSLKVLASPVVSAYNISLTGLDVPVNLKYEFNPKKSDSYLAAGLSSGTFISETYNYSYDNSKNALGASPSIPDASVSRSFTRFDFARTLNLSLGMGYQITKGNRLIIEPFLKYPLSGMGSQDIRFGSGGINLRLKFQGSNKK